MKNILIVSMCTRILKAEYEFHFKGALWGEAVARVLLKSEFAVIKGEEYLLYVAVESVENGVLRGRILKLKLLSECWDKS